jgi:glycosyltransferase involved in cell wall biosynthesis
MATRKPIVAVREGGYLKSIIDEETELLVEANIESIVRTISIVAKDPEKYKNSCMQRAKLFDPS